MRIMLAALWLLLGAAKVLDPTPFAQFLELHLEAGTGTSSALAWVIIAGELALGVALLVKGRHLRVVACWLSIGAAIAATSLALAAPQVPCGCFGKFMRATAARRLIVAGTIAFPATSVLLQGVGAARASRRLATEN